jgi:hypothetical protein
MYKKKEETEMTYEKKETEEEGNQNLTARRDFGDIDWKKLCLKVTNTNSC